MTAAALIRAKHAQAAALMREQGLDCWLIEFARETGLRPDPLGYLVGAAVTWPSAFLLHRDGSSRAIVGTGDVAALQATGAWDDIRGYVASLREELLQVLEEWSPERIGVSWSESDDTADGITLGMYRLLEQCLAGTPYRDRLVGAGDLAGAVRRRKLPPEVEGIQHAVDACLELFSRIESYLEPGLTETELQQRIQAWIRDTGLGFAWDPAIDPIVSFGPRRGPVGHTPPGEQALLPGHVIHVDLGVIRDGFASDLQRTWYWRRPGETEAPEPVRRTFAAALAAMDAGFAALQPGRRGFEVDAASRAAVGAAGFPEPPFAFGHPLGQVAHDGGALLGPRWERYGRTPEVEVEPGNVFALEMDLEVPELGGLVGLEEEVVVDAAGARHLSRPQRELWLLGG